MVRFLSVAACAVVLGCLSLSAVLAEDKPAARRPESPAAKPSPIRVGEAAIKQALAQPTELNFADTPLGDVIEYLKNAHRIEIQLDKKALDDMGVSSETPITKSVRGGLLRSALNLMLKDLGLTWIIQDEVLLITTPDEAEGPDAMLTKVYPVGDLVVCRDKNNEPWDDYNTLIDVIVSTIRPVAWEDVGGQGSITGASLGTAKVLIVNQTQAIHEEIAKLLADICEIAKKNPDEKLPKRDKPSPERAKIPGSTGRIGIGMGGGMGMF